MACAAISTRRRVLWQPTCRPSAGPRPASRVRPRSPHWPRRALPRQAAAARGWSGASSSTSCAPCAPPCRTKAGCALAAEPDASLIAGWWHGSSLAAFGRADAAESERVARRCIADGDVFVWDVGRPVSMAVKTGPTRTGITVGRVYTPPEERGRGYATACVAELSRMLLTEGRDHCILFVEASNAAAQRLYLRVGYRPVAEFLELALEE